MDVPTKNGRLKAPAKPPSTLMGELGVLVHSFLYLHDIRWIIGILGPVKTQL